MPIHPELSPTQNIRPTFQVIVDAHGLPASDDLLRYTAYFLGNVWRSTFMDSCFWVTRTDLFYDFQSRSGPAIIATKITHESRHEPSFDLYQDGGIVPIARLINVALPKEIQ